MSSLTVEHIAQVCHEANRALTAVIGDVPVQPHWEYTSWDMKQSCMQGVEFTLCNPKATAEDQHNAWMKERLSKGWVYGAEKNESTKTHPALIPYGQLNEDVRRKDKLFRAVIQALL